MTDIRATAIVLLACLVGCHSDLINLDVQQATGDRSFTPGESRELVVSVYGGGDRFKNSYYRGPVEVACSPPAGVTVAPAPLVIDMRPVNNYDRSRSSGNLTVTIAADMPAGDYELPITAVTGKQTSAEAWFQFKISGE